jgi:hypothetical protein
MDHQSAQNLVDAANSGQHGNSQQLRFGVCPKNSAEMPHARAPRSEIVDYRWVRLGSALETKRAIFTAFDYESIPSQGTATGSRNVCGLEGARKESLTPVLTDVSRASQQVWAIGGKNAQAPSPHRLYMNYALHRAFSSLDLGRRHLAALFLAERRF